MSIIDNLTGIEKTAILLISLGKHFAAKILKYFENEEIEKITYEIANYQAVGAEDRSKIIQSYYQMCLTQEYISEGGIEYAKEVLTEALGAQKSIELIARMSENSKQRLFGFMKDVDPQEIFNFIQQEGDQTIAFVLSYLQPKQSAEVLSMLPNERQIDVVKRIALMDKISPEVAREVEKVMEEKFIGTVAATYTESETEGIEIIVDILNSVDRGTEKKIFEKLNIEDSQLANEIKRRMFVFEDIVSLGSREIQKFLSQVDNNDLAVALKVSTEEVKSLIFKNLSKRISDVIKEEIELMGPVRLSEVEKSQQKLVSIIRELEEKGEIIIRKNKGDEIIG